MSKGDFMDERKKRRLPDGVFPVALTPFGADGGIDLEAFGRLIDWYVKEGAAGLFAVCMSGEFFQLSDEERTALARRAVEAAAGRVPVMVGAGFGSTLNEQKRSVRTAADSGADGVVIPASLLAAADDPESRVVDNFLRMMEAAPDTLFGIYECPAPYHRLLSPAALAEIARRAEGRLGFIKDTCCDLAAIREKLAALTGSGVALYNAHTATMLASLRAGAAGYCGLSANYFPALIAELIACFRRAPERAEQIQAICDLLQRHVDYKYPAAAKRFLSLCGVEMNDACRMAPARPLEPDDTAALLNLRNFINGWEREYAFASIATASH